MRKFITFLLVAAVVLTPSTALARKEKDKKKYAKKEVVIDPKAEQSSTPSAVVITDPARQLYGEWTLLTIKDKPVITDNRAYIYLDFAAGKVYGNNGCNDLNGTFQLEGKQLTFGSMITTERSCHNGSSERSFMKALADVRQYELLRLYNIEYLSLQNSKGHEIMRMKRQNLDLLNGAWTVKEIHGNNVSDRNVRVVVDADLQTIHGDTGCNIVNGLISIDTDTRKDMAVQFEDLHSTNYPCENIGAETNLLIALEQTVTCKRINDNEVALLDNKGTIVLVLHRLQLR